MYEQTRDGVDTAFDLPHRMYENLYFHETLMRADITGAYKFIRSL
jgi:hypothetical protein